MARVNKTTEPTEKAKVKKSSGTMKKDANASSSKFSTHEEVFERVANDVEPETYTPAQYFEIVKGKKENETVDNIKRLYDVTMTKLKKYMITGQVSGAKELYSKCLYLEKELQLLNKGVTTYVKRETIENYIDKIADEAVCIIELSGFERDIPDELINIVAATKDIFDEFFVVFTDYTGEKRQKIAQEKRDKDPILFGNIFIDGRVSEKMYFIGDWIDDYCNLTLDKMIDDICKKEKKSESDIKYDINDTSNLDDIETALFGTSKRLRARMSAVETTE